MKKGARFLNLKLGKRATNRSKPWTLRPLKKIVKRTGMGR